MAIVRTNFVDDDGSGTYGTVINNAIKTELYDQIDAALAALVGGAGAISGTTGTFSGAVSVAGLLTVSGFGTHTFSAGGTGGNGLHVVNSTPGTGNSARIRIDTDITENLVLRGLSSTYTTAGPYVASGGSIDSAGVGGLSLMAGHASGAIRWYSGGTTKNAELEADGDMWFIANVSALSITDRTPYPVDLATARAAVLSMRRLPDGAYDPSDSANQLDHATLHPSIQSIKRKDRNLSATVSSLVWVAQDADERIVALEKELASLKARIH